MRLVIDESVINSFNEVSTDKSGYVFVCCLSSVIIFYADVKEVTKMSLAKVQTDDEFSFRAPVEVLRNVIQLGELVIDKQELLDDKVNLIMQQFNSFNELKITITIPYQPCIVQDTVMDIYNAMRSDNYKYIEDLTCFKKMSNMCRPASKDIQISGAQIRDNKITVIANGYYAESKDATGLQITIPISTLKAINSFLVDFNRVKFVTLNSYNYLIGGNSVIGWRRVRTEKLDYEINTQTILSFEVGYLRGVINSIVSPVKSVILSVSRKMLVIETAVANTTIPLNIITEQETISDFEVNYKLFFSLIKGFTGVINIGFFNKSLTIQNNGITYIIGRTI